MTASTETNNENQFEGAERELRAEEYTILYITLLWSRQIADRKGDCALDTLWIKRKLLKCNWEKSFK